ncbi:very short patch repair endonuclease [Mycolicibacterium peregrinum]|uniref:very short patch repair endonuclease n=1 Tax=Mycolicibacterium peregrinum TaxID=43304 RepID=UPI003AAE0C4A
MAKRGAPTPTQPGYATSPGRSRNMAAIRRADTQPEIAVRSELHRLGYRFRKDFPIRIDGRLIRPDIVFTKRKVAIFVDGCFWHCCPEHGQTPKVNSEYWSPKLDRNVVRDRMQTGALESAGWTVLRFWSHDPADVVADAVNQMLSG